VEDEFKLTLSLFTWCVTA